MRGLVILLICSFSAAELTGCQKCLEPGGDCSKAFKGNQGYGCGTLNGLGYCCPGTPGMPGSAKCWDCKTHFQCYTGSRPSPNICGAGQESYLPHRTSVGFPRQGGGEVSSMITMIIVIASMAMIGSSIMACMRANRTMPLAGQQGVIEMPTAKPCAPGVAMPAGTPVAQAYPAQHGYPAGCCGGVYPQQGYSGGNVAMGAGMGFLGGMMVSDMMSHHHGGGYGEGYGGDYGGGGGFGGDMGGGDMGGDFAADM